MTNNRMRIRHAQLNFVVGDIDGNLKRHIEIYKQAQKDGIGLVIFPECSLTSYPLQDILGQEYIIRDAMEAGEKLAKKTDDKTAILFGLPRIAEDGKIYNTAAFAVGGKIVPPADKDDLPHDDELDDKRHFSEGELVEPVEYCGFKLARIICHGIWRKDAALHAAACSADAILTINASPFFVNKHYLRKEVIQERVVECGLPISYLNLVGAQDSIGFDGTSFACNPGGGKLVGLQPSFEESVYDLTLVRGEDGKCTFEADKNPEFDMCIEEQQYKGTVMGTRDYSQKNGLTTGVLALSGGMDSAMELPIAMDAFNGNVIVVFMPYKLGKVTKDESLEYAEQLAKNAGLPLIVSSIDDAVAQEVRDLEAIGFKPTGTALEGIQAKVRGKRITTISTQLIENGVPAMVLNTSTKTEALLGNCTTDGGDTVGGYAPLQDWWKGSIHEDIEDLHADGRTSVVQVARWYNKQYGEYIPEAIIVRPPSAELMEDQVDTDIVPDNTITDPILKLFVEDLISAADIVEMGFSPSDVRKVISRIARNHHKIDKLPKGFKVTPGSVIKVQYRMPNTNRCNYLKDVPETA